MNAPFSLTGTIKAAAGDKPRRLSILGYSGGIMSVSGFGPIVLNLEGVSLPTSVPILDSHENTLSSMVGSGRPFVSGGSIVVDVTVGSTEAGNRVIALLESGISLQASVGCKPIRTERIEAKKTVSVNGRQFQAGPGGLTLVHESELGEVSIVPAGADNSTTVSIAARAAKGKISMTNYRAMLRASGKFSADEIDEMTEEEAKAALKKCMKSSGDSADDDEKPASASALQQILGNCPASVGIRAGAERWSERRARSEALFHIRASRPGAGVGVGGNGGSFDYSENHLVAAMLVRCGLSEFAEKKLGEFTLEQSKPFFRASMVQLLSASLNLRGVAHDPNDTESVIRAAGASSAGLSSLLANVLGKVLEAQWLASPATWRSWCAIKQAKDFKAQSSVRPSFMGTLAQLGNGGEISHGSIEDAAIPWSVYTFAKMLTIPRQTIINDDLGGLTEIPMAFAAMSERALSDLIYSTLMADAGSNFSSGNGNLLTGATSPLSSAGLAIAIKNLRNQTSPGGSPLNMPPHVLIVPPALEQVAREIINSTLMMRVQTSDRLPMGNSLKDICAVEVESRLGLGCTSPISGSTAQTGSDLKWYLMSTPDRLPGIVGFLGTGQGPIIEQSGPDFNFDTPGQSIRCLLDCGFALGDYRAAQKSNAV